MPSTLPEIPTLLVAPMATTNGVHTSTNPDAWRDFLDKEADGVILKATFHNARLYLEHHPDFRGTVVWNDYAKKLELRSEPGKSPLIKYAKHDANGIVAGIQDHLAHAHRISIAFNDLTRRVMTVARDNAYNPLVDHLKSLRWDNTPRVDDFFIRYFGAGARDGIPVDMELFSHLRRISRRWLLGAVERAFRPGCKVDNILILEGLQRARKTSALEALGGDYYCSTQIVLGDKDSKMIAASNWFVDMPDTKFMKKDNRGFVTMREDTFRPPFGASVEHSKRCCILIGSMNDYQYFEEEERRYWPVRCGQVDLQALLRDRDNIWAEAVAISLASETCPACATSTDTVYGQRPRCADHRWWLDTEEEQVSSREAAERIQDVPWKLLIHEWWLGMEPDKRPPYFTTEDIAMNVLQLDEAAFARGDKIATAIGIAVKSLGFTKARENISGVRHWVYKPTHALTNVLSTKKPTRGLFAVAGGKVADKK